MMSPPPAPIAAIATPPGAGAIAMVRLSGEGCAALAERFLDSPLRNSPPRFARFARILDPSRRVVDEVLATRFVPPSSYTGEEMVEITCHGGSLVAGSILGLFLREGARLAGPGEFTQRAFLAGKLDLTQAEAVMDLIHAKTPLALRAAAEQLEGRIGRETEAIRLLLLETLAHLEAWIDFPEEGISPETGMSLAEKMERAGSRIANLLDTADEGRLLREGVRLAICGLPNAGKSSVLNRLLGFERAIVSELPGTTRDTIEEVACLEGIPFRIIDTAGLRHDADPVERQGIERARQAIAQADVVLEVVDATTGARGGIDPDGKPLVLALNKCDLPNSCSPPHDDCARISCLTGEGLPALVDRLAAVAGHHQPDANASPAAINARHQACLTRANQSLSTAIAAVRNGLEPELAAVDLRAALDAVGEVAGQTDTEEILGKIFSSFCIGK